VADAARGLGIRVLEVDGFRDAETTVLVVSVPAGSKRLSWLTTS
jgi:hypothetical protein